MPEPSPNEVPVHSPDFYQAFVAQLEAKAAELTSIAETVRAATEVEVSNQNVLLRLDGARISHIEFSDAAVSAAKSGLAQQVMGLYLDGQAQLARGNAEVLSGLGIDVMSGMTPDVQQRAAEQEDES